MYAIVEIAGQQYKVEKDQQVFVHRLEGKEGSKVSFDNVLLTADGDKIEVGAPAVKGISVSAKIVEHLKGDKVIVFKKKRRKGYKVRNGHRQYLSKIEITGIGKSTAAPKKVATAEKKEAAPKAAAKKATETKAAPKAEANKATTAKAATAKKAAPKAAAKPAATKAKAETKATAKPKAAAKKTTAKKAAPKKDAEKKDDK